jgi:hypothetical protein
MLNHMLAGAALVCISCAAGAQSMPKLPGTSALTKGLPNVSAIGPGNAAGLLSYCVKNKYLGGSSAGSVVDGLMKKPGVKGSSGLTAGQAGNIVNGKAAPVSMGSVPKELKSQACNMVLKRGTSLL